MRKRDWTSPPPAAFVGREHLLPVRIYYEDTDFTGVVYHANYLRYFERGRTDFLRLVGVSHAAPAGPARPGGLHGHPDRPSTSNAPRASTTRWWCAPPIDAVQGPAPVHPPADHARRGADRRAPRSRRPASTSTAARAGRRRSMAERLAPLSASPGAIVSPPPSAHRAHASDRKRTGPRMDPAGAVTPESFSLVPLFLRADWVVKVVMLGLACASLWSWTVIIDKTVPLRRAEPRGRPLRGRRSAPASALEEVAADGRRAPPPRPAAHAAGARCANGARPAPRAC